MKHLVLLIFVFLTGALLQAQTIEEFQKQGESLMNEGKNEEALAKFKEAIALDKTTDGNSLLYAYAGLCAENASDAETAQGFFRSAIERGFGEDIIYTKLGEIYKKEKNFEGQEFVFKKGMIVFPDKEYYFGKKLAYTYYNSKQYAKLESLTTQLLLLRPDDTKMMQFKATSFQGQKKMKEAKAAFEKLIEINPENLSANIFLGNYAYQVGKMQIDKETKKYEAIPKPTRAQYSQFQKKIKITIGNAYGKAIPYLEKANELKPDDKNIRKMLYAIYMKKQEKDKAAQFAPAP